MGKAIDFINAIGLNNIESHLEELTKYLYKRLQEIDLEIEFLPGPIFCKKAIAGYGIIPFNIKGINPTDVGFVLSENRESLHFKRRFGTPKYQGKPSYL